MAEGKVKYFTVEEANLLLPAIESRLLAMDGLVARRGELSELLEDMEVYWGQAVKGADNPEHEKYLRLQGEMAEVSSAIDGNVVAIHEIGGHLKSHEQGLVDFYHEMDGRPVFLCWQRGEERVEFYHELDAGFQGRKPIGQR